MHVQFAAEIGGVGQRDLQEDHRVLRRDVVLRALLLLLETQGVLAGRVGVVRDELDVPAGDSRRRSPPPSSSSTMLLARSSNDRPTRETSDTMMIARMNSEAIFTPSGRSMMLTMVV